MSENENQGLDNMHENPDDLSLTVKEAAQQVQESPHVIRNWMRELKNHIQTKKGGNNYHYFNQEAIERLLLIKTLIREQGYSLKQVNYFLSTGEDPLIPEETPEQQNKVLDDLQEIKVKLEKQEQFNQALLKKLEEQNQYINDSINRRDKQLLNAMRQMTQTRLETSATSEKKSFWTRLFKKDEK